MVDLGSALADNPLIAILRGLKPKTLVLFLAS